MGDAAEGQKCGKCGSRLVGIRAIEKYVRSIAGRGWKAASVERAGVNYAAGIQRFNWNEPCGACLSAYRGDVRRMMG